MITIAVLTLLMSAEVEAPAQAPAAEKKICRTEQQLGSRLRKSKTCRTPAEWKLFMADREDMRRDLGRAAKGPGNGQ